MPVWGERYIEYLLTFGLPTLLAPNNLPWLPNRSVSQFTFITRAEDEKRIRASKLFAKLEALISVKFLFLDLYQSGGKEKFGQLGNGLRRGASDALGRGYCLFCQPDSIYSDGTLKFLYGVARSGKKACVTHGPSAALEKIVPYLRERNLLTFDEVNPLASRVLARALLENQHPDEAVHCMGNPHYPLGPYMGFWLSPKLDGALFRFVSLHPFLADLSHLSELEGFTAIDHDFIRAHGFIWSDVHVETDSDHIMVINAKPEKERNAIPNPEITLAPITHLARALFESSNCNYSRFCFFHGLKVHTGELDRDWHDFEVANLRWINTNTNNFLAGIQAAANTNANVTVTNTSLFSSLIMNIYRRSLIRLFQADTYRYYWGLIVSAKEKFLRLAIIQRQPLEALKYFFNILLKLLGMILRLVPRPLRPRVRLFHVRDHQPAVTSSPAIAGPPIPPEFCAVCRPDARRCVSADRCS